MSSVAAQAQQRPLYSQYMFNGVVMNAAYAGAHEALSIAVSNRSQWSGLDGAPETFTFAAHALLEARRLGFGLTLNKDQIGVHKNLVLNGSVAYHLDISPDDILSFGLQAGIRNHKADYLSISGNQYDPRVAASSPGQTFPDLGAGVYFRNKRFEGGISVPGLMPSDWSRTDSTSIRARNTHWLFFSKYSMPLTSSLDLIPSLFFQYYPGVPPSIDLSAGLLMHKSVFTGISYRRHESVDFLLRASVTPQLTVGYCYDLMIGQVRALSSASHEIALNYLFKFSGRKIATPR